MKAMVEIYVIHMNRKEDTSLEERAGKWQLNLREWYLLAQ